MKGIQISKKDLNKLAKEKGVKKITRLTAKEFREPQNRSAQKSTNHFSFSYDIQSREEEYIVTLKGKHLAKNRFDSLSFKDKIRYKNAFKNAINEFKLINRRLLKSFETFKRAEVRYFFHNPRSRDGDGNSENIKKFQDSLFSLGLIEDDKRSCLVCVGNDEVISKEYMMKAHIKELRSN